MVGSSALGLMARVAGALFPAPKIYPPLPAGAADEVTSLPDATTAPEPDGPPVAILRQQWGLRLPNGSVVWDNSLWLGRSLATPEDRTVLVEVLRKTAVEIGFEEATFLGCYGWATRLGVPSMAWGPIELVPLAGTEEENAGRDSISESVSEQNNENSLPT